MSTKIFVMTHKAFDVPKDPVYIPLHVGREGGEDFGYTGDNTGDNISAKNCYYSELTGLYWVAHNVMEGDYFGLCHYRRFFLNDEGRLLDEISYERILKEYDVILAKAVYHPASYYEVYAQAHNIHDLQVTGEVLKELYPEDYKVFEEVIAGRKVYSGNMFVTSREKFCDYEQWLFSVFDRVEKRIHPDDYDAYHRRVFGFLSEQLLYVWVKSRGLSIYEAPVGLTQEKAETIELKEGLRVKLAKGNIDGVREALELFRSTMKERPDLMLSASDLSGELADMFRVLYVCEQELTAGTEGMLAITKDLSLLVRHYRLLCTIAGKIAAGNVTTQELSYYKDSRISGSLIQMIVNTNPNLKPCEGLLRSACDSF